MQELAPDNTAVTTENDYKEIILTEDETAEALRKGRESKFFAMKLADYQDKISKQIDWSYPTPREFYDRLRETKSANGGRYQVNDDNKNLIFALCLYFARDSRFCEYGDNFSLDKGILLMGPAGVGKSHLMSFFSKNPNCSYVHVTCKAIGEAYVTKDWERGGLTPIEYYSSSYKAEFGHQWDQTELGFCFGDLGTENDKNSFGNKMNIMEHVIFERYEKKIPFNQTHITTNLNANEIQEKYGVRVRDRLKEMCNVFMIDGKSFR